MHIVQIDISQDVDERSVFVFSADILCKVLNYCLDFFWNFVLQFAPGQVKAWFFIQIASFQGIFFQRFNYFFGKVISKLFTCLFID